MTHEILHLEGACHVIYDDSIRALIVTWENFYGVQDAVRKSTKAQMKAVPEYGALTIIVDASKVSGIVAEEDQEWMGKVLFPSLYESRLRAVITVSPKGAVGKLASHQWKKIGESNNIEMPECTTVSKARVIAARYMK